MYLIHSLTGAGTTRQAALICEELRRLGTNVTLLVGSRIGVNKDQFDDVSYPVEFLSSKAMGYAAFVWRLKNFLNNHPDCLLLSGAKKVNIKAIDAHRLSRHKGGLILTLTNNIAQYSTQSETSKEGSVRKHYRKYKFANKVIVISKAMEAELLRQGFRSDILAFCPPPIDVQDILKQASRHVDHHWLQPPRDKRDVPVILSAGRYDPQKNFPLLIRAFAKARAQRKLRLIILGTGDVRELEKYKNLTRELDVETDVDFAGFDSNPFALMAKADLFALSSDWEGFGLVLAEALVCGTAVLSTDCPHGPSEILTGTEASALTPIGDAEQMAQEMLRLVSNESRRSTMNVDAMRRYDKSVVGQTYKAIVGSFY